MDKVELRFSDMLLLGLILFGFAYWTMGGFQGETILKAQLDNEATFNNRMVRIKDARIKVLTKELADIKSNLMSVKNDLDAANAKLTILTTVPAQPIAAELAPEPVASVTVVPAPAY